MFERIGKIKGFSTIALFTLAILVVGCGPATANPELSGGAASPPEQVVEDFYVWFLELGPNGELNDFRESPLISSAGMSAIEETLAGGLGANPIVCAQDIPESVEVGKASVSGDQAEVLVESSFGNSIAVTLELVGEQWFISDFSCQ